jgi:hypothetical protein
LSERTEDLRATAEDLIEDADRLKAIEEAKLTLQPGDGQLARLSSEGERIVRRMVPKAAAQKELATELEAEPG